MSDEMNNVGATPATEPSTGSQDAPLLIFSDDAGNQINEISLAPGEQKKIKVILSNHPEGITQNFLAQWSVYDPNHQLTSGISCVMDSDGKKWLNPLYLSTTDESVGGMSGNDLNSARMGNGVWRCMGKNPNGQFWYPRDMYIPPVPVAEFVLMASSDWTDKYATFELDNNVTKFVMTTETGTPAANGTTVTCNYSMKLTVNNANASNVTPPQENNDGQVTPPPQENGGGQVTPAPQNNDGETVPPQEDNGGATPIPPQNNEPFPNFPNSSTPKLVFGDEAGKPIKEISLAPGEERTIQVILYQHPEVITKAFQADWNMYDSNHEPTTSVTCKKEGNGWIYPLGLSTYSKAEGGMNGNMLQSAEIDISTWRCIGMNSMTNQFWYPRDQFTTPVPVAEFTVMAANDWTDKYASFELDPKATEFVLASDTAVPSSSKILAQCDYDMVLTIKNANAGNVTPPQENNDGQVTPPPQENDGITYSNGSPIAFDGKPLVSGVLLNIDLSSVEGPRKGLFGAQQKTLRIAFCYNTFTLHTDSTGNVTKVIKDRYVIDEKEYVCPSKKNDVRPIQLPQGVYFDGAQVLIKVYFRKRNNDFNWKTTNDCGILDASSGKINLKFTGSTTEYAKAVCLANDSPSQIIGIDNEAKIYLQRLDAQRSQQEEKERREKEKEKERKQKEEEECKKREEEDRKRKEEEEKRKENEINEFINHYPIISIEDGFSTPPKIEQEVKETGAWVRASRESKSGTWFMVNEEMNSRYIYPGNVILVDKDKNFTKNLVEVPFLANERKPLRLDAKYSNELSNSSTLLSSFTRADVNTFVDACLTNFKESKHDLGSNTSWTYESTERKEGITLGGTIKGVKFSGSIGRNKTVTVAYMKQVMYTVSLNNEYSRPSEIFTNEVDIEKFRRNIEINHTECTPAIIDAVKYGRLITIWVVQEGNEPASLTIDGFNLSVSRTNKSTKYYMLVIGGVAGKDIDKDKENSTFIDTDSQQTIKNALANMKEVSKLAMETATPIEFSVKALANMTTNIEWKVLPYYKTYIPEVKFRVIDDNTGASMKCAVYYLRYVYYGDKPNYRLDEVDGKKLDYTFQCSPKSLCFDIKVDVVATDPNDFNVMLPCIPYDSIQPNEEGEWVFEISFYGSNFWDAKKFRCNPTVPGAVLSTSNKIFMKDYNNSPLRQYSNTGTSERIILQAYMDWTKMMVNAKKNLSFKTPLDKLSDLRPYYE